MKSSTLCCDRLRGHVGVCDGIQPERVEPVITKHAAFRCSTRLHIWYLIQSLRSVADVSMNELSLLVFSRGAFRSGKTARQVQHSTPPHSFHLVSAALFRRFLRSFNRAFFELERQHFDFISRGVLFEARAVMLLVWFDLGSSIGLGQQFRCWQKTTSHHVFILVTCAKWQHEHRQVYVRLRLSISLRAILIKISSMAMRLGTDWPQRPRVVLHFIRRVMQGFVIAFSHKPLNNGSGLWTWGKNDIGQSELKGAKANYLSPTGSGPRQQQ